MFFSYKKKIKKKEKGKKEKWYKGEKKEIENKKQRKEKERETKISTVYSQEERKALKEIKIVLIPKIKLCRL